MRWRQFLFSLVVGLVLSLGYACVQSTPTGTPPPSDMAPGATLEAPSTPGLVGEAETMTLSPEAAALVASAGPQGLANPPRGDVRLVVISDLNGPYGSTDYDPEVDRAMMLLPFWQPDMVVCSGDMVGGQDLTLTDAQLQAMWDAFDHHVAAPLREANLPYGFTIGNHDASGALGVNGKFLFEKERTVAIAYWDHPDHDPGVEFIDRNEFPFYYTFKQGDVFFLAWDGSSHHIPDDKLAWVEQALASPAAQQAKLRILLGHLPLYAISVGRDEPGEVMENADKLRAMLEQYNVHTYISGHHHTYYPGHRGDLQLLHMGILGSGPRPLIDSNLPPRKTLTVMDIDFDSPELTTYTTYDMQTLKTIQYEELPRLVAGHNGAVLRRDVEWEDLDASEQAFCEQRLSKAQCEA